MITEDQIKEALNIVEEYQKQTGIGSDNECDHQKAWLAVGGNYYCPKCKTSFKILRCRVCKGSGGFNVPIENPKSDV